MRKTTRGKGLAGGTAVAAVIAGLALLQSLGLAAVWGALSPAVRALALAGAAAQLAAAVGVTVALFHRWKEIRGGEEDEAKNTDREQAEQKREAVKSVLISAGFRVGAAALLFCTRSRTPWPGLHQVLLWLAVLGLVTIPFSLVVLRQRLREIEKGELNEARKY